MTFLNTSDFGTLRDLAARWGKGRMSARYGSELDGALNTIAARSTDGPCFLDANVHGDSIPEMEAAALLLAACLYGPEAKLEVVDTGTVRTHHRAVGERFTAFVRVRCLNYEEVRQ
jgi:hypothetical protein